MIKKIKTKARKTIEISDYKYGGKKVNVEKEKEHKDETISNKYVVAQLLPPEDKYKLQILWKEKQTESSACIWFGARYDNCVFINDIKNLVKGTDISNCTIDAYIEILEKELQTQNSGDGAEHNGKSFVLSSLYWKLESSLELRMRRIGSISSLRFRQNRGFEAEIEVYFAQDLSSLEVFI
ncbi:hypothetical protein LOK49_LG05G01789 [Camellia lanceoleosa]|uniref:Uncharacterized protein n=1 Tax=Camellia lanceoleosa TaxID=1840588 RepID=A0ACC0HRK2_9ERIC|nr:hypothetical protein LOK49_LG05G01789 [Camellia lanceoleosa]